LFQNLGYAAEQLPTSKDFGADLILVTGDKRIAVQAKRYKGNVGNRAVQMILGAKRYYDCDEAWIVSNSFYTKAAIQMAVKTDVRLYDRNGLLQFMTMNQALPK
jgi:restriction system protein